MLDEVLFLEISNLARQLKFIPEEGYDHPVISHLTNSLWLRKTDLTITSSTNSMRGPISDRKNVAGAEKQLEPMGYRLTQEKRRSPFLTPRLQNVTDKTRESAAPLIKQIWELLKEQLEILETRDMTVGTFVTSANEVTIAGFWNEQAKGELMIRKTHKILRFLSSSWQKKYKDKVFHAGNTIFEAFVQDLLSISHNLLLALYLV